MTNRISNCGGGAEPEESLSPEQMRKTIRTLQANQLQLERQNEELRHALRVQTENPHLYRLLFDNMRNGLAYCRMVFENGKPQDFIFLAVNHAFKMQSGLQDIIGKRVSEVISGVRDADPRLFDICGRVTATGLPEQCEIFLKSLQVWFSISVYCPEPEHFVAVVDDVTDRKKAEEALRASEKDLRESQRIAHIGSWRLNVATNQVVWSEELYKMYGFDPALPPPPYTEHRKLFTPESWERLSTALANTRETGIPYTLELETIKRDGSHGFMWVHGETEADAAGKTIGLWGAAQDITERKQIQEALHRAEIRFQKAFYSSPDAICINRLRDGLYVEFNAGALAFLGYTKEELAGRTSADLRVWADPTERERWIGALFAKGEVANFEARFKRKDRSERVAQVSANLIFLDGEAHILSTTRDITERKRLEAEKFESEQRLTDILSSMADWVWEVDEHGFYTYSSEKSRNLFGPLRGDVIGKKPFDFMPPEEVARILPILNDRAARKAPIKDLENWKINGNGERICLLTNGVPIVDKEGHFKGYRGVDKDITERKQAEENLARSHELLVNLARLVPGVIYQYRLYPDGRSAFPYSSPGMELVYEVTPDEVREDATPVFGRLHPEDYTMVANAIEASARTLETFYCEFRVVLPRQGLRWRWSQAQPQRMTDGSTLWHGIILDIHERKTTQLEKAALEFQLQQAQKMESVGRLAGGVAHDFNNMLGVILGNAEIALDRVPAEDPLRRDLEEISKAAMRSADLTRQLLAFARRQTITPKVLNLGETVSGLVTMLQRLIGEAVHLEWRPEPDLWLVRMDPSQVDQVLANLCINARDAMSGSGRLTIRVGNATLDAEFCESFGAVEPGDYLRLSVTDTGCGMDPETQAHLFEPFFTTKALGKGTGLGLATVYGIVKQNGGFVRVESAVGHGTTMTVYLPRHRGSEGAAASAPTSFLPQGRGMVLLVEDEPAMLSMTCTLLESMGYTIIAAGSAEDALRVAASRASEIRILLTDVVMPDMNGKDLATIVAARYPHVRVVFMSGYTADIIALHGLIDDHVLFLQKPFTREALAFKMSEALETAPTPPIP